MRPYTLVGRLIFGAWMLANGANHFFYPLWSLPSGHQPLAIQLMSALVHSGLLGVAMAIQLVSGALLLTGFFVPLALCVVMPISTCALFWSVILDHQPAGALTALIAFALNGLLMLAYLPYYQGALQRHALTFGESTGESKSFSLVYVNPNGRSARGQFIAALLVLLLVAWFYEYIVTGLTAHWCLFMLVFPALMLHARRLHDMGYSAWLLLLPGVLGVSAFGIWLKFANFGALLNTDIPVAALIVSAGFALWGCAGSGQATANRFGTPAAA